MFKLNLMIKEQAKISAMQFIAYFNQWLKGGHHYFFIVTSYFKASSSWQTEKTETIMWSAYESFNSLKIIILVHLACWGYVFGSKHKHKVKKENTLSLLLIIDRTSCSASFIQPIKTTIH